MNIPLHLKFTLISILILIKYINGQKLDEFTIGTWYDPRLTFKNDKADSLTLDSVKQAGFNMLSGYNLTNENRISEVTYVADLLNKIGGIRLLAMDNRIDFRKFNEDSCKSILWDYSKISDQLKVNIAGFHLGDEPNIEQIGEVNEWINCLHKNSYNYISFTSLLPTYVGYDTATYRRYISEFCTNDGDIISFNHYPFLNFGMRPDYYWNLYVLADEVLKSIKPKIIWTIIYATEHYFLDKNKVKKPHYYLPISSSTLRYTVFAPLLFNAKGIYYFTYETPGKDDWDAEFEAAARENPIIYNYIKEINRELSSIGSILVPLQWECVIRGGIKHPYSKEDFRNISVSKYGGVSIENPYAMAAAYTDGKKQKYFLVMNMDTANLNNVIVNSDRPINFEIYDIELKQWIAPNRSWKRKIAIGIPPASIKLLRIRKN